MLRLSISILTLVLRLMNDDHMIKLNTIVHVVLINNILKNEVFVIKFINM